MEIQQLLARSTVHIKVAPLPKHVKQPNVVIVIAIGYTCMLTVDILARLVPSTGADLLITVEP